MVAVTYSILWILAAWKWGDWHNWIKYYPTALFSVVGNLLYEVVCSEYQMWAMEPNGLPNQTLPILLLSIIGMPLSVFIFLSKYPFKQSIIRQAIYILFFTFIFVVLEFISVQLGSITYHNGWNLYWSLLFDVVMFIILYIHFKHPKIAILLSVGVVVALSTIFNLTFDKMK